MIQNSKQKQTEPVYSGEEKEGEGGQEGGEDTYVLTIGMQEADRSRNKNDIWFVFCYTLK